MGTDDSDSDSTDRNEALKDLFEQQKWLLRLAERLVRDDSAAMDLVQETFLAAIKNPPMDHDRPRAWLSVVARRIQRKQQAKFWPDCVEGLDDLELSSGLLPEEDAMRRELLSILHEAVKSLEPMAQEAILLAYVQELDQSKVAERMNLSPEAVRELLTASNREIGKHLGRLRWTRAEREKNPGQRPVIDPGSAPPEENGGHR